MLINSINIILFPEIFLSISILVLLLIGLFQKENSFRNICNLSTIILITTFFLIYFDQDLHIANYESFFKDSSFIQFFKYLIILGSAACIIISKNYFIESKLARFEIPILILSYFQKFFYQYQF